MADEQTGTTTPTQAPTEAPVSHPAPEKKAATSIREASRQLREAGAYPESQDAVAPDPALVADPITGEPDPNAPHWAQQTRNPDGTFGPKSDETATAEATAETAEGAEAVEGEAATGEEAAEERKPVLVSLPSGKDGEPEIEIALDGENAERIAERIAFLKNNGMRKQEFQKRLDAVERREGEVEQFVAAMETVPEMIVGNLNPAIRDRIFRALLPQYIEQSPELIEQWYNDPAARRLGLAELRESTVEGREQLSQRTTAAERARSVVKAVENLIPAHASDQDAEDFRADSLRYLASLRPEAVTPENVGEHLARYRHRYGFDRDASGAGTAGAVATGTPHKLTATASPVGDAALRLRAAQAASARLKEAQATRDAAAKLAREGAGAQPAARPAPPPNLNIQQAGKWLRQNGGRSW